MKIAIIITLSLVAAALLFPIRTGVINNPGQVIEVPMGPHFVASAPSNVAVCEAYLGKSFDDPSQIANKHRASSHVDYGRTVLFAGGAATLGLLVVLIISAKNSALRIAPAHPSSNPQAQQERLA